MNIYIYTKTGHNVGLDALRRGAVLYAKLKASDPLLCTSDYRAATFARELGVHKGIGVDVIENLPNLMERGDMLIFDSDEPSDTTKEFMKEYCTKLYEVGVDIPKTIVDDKFFEKGDQSIEKTFFFGDDDYFDVLLKRLVTQKVDINLLMGHYFFLGNDEKLSQYFANIIDEEEYFETILNTKYLLTSSVNAVFESLAAGNFPVYYHREDKSIDEKQLLETYNIPVVNGDNLSEIIVRFEKIISNYPQVKKLEKVDISNIVDDISKVIEQFKAIMPSLENNY